MREWLATGAAIPVHQGEIVTDDDPARIEFARRVDLADRAELMARAYFGGFREANQFALELMKEARTWRINIGPRSPEVINSEEGHARAMGNLEARASLGTRDAPITEGSD